MKKIISLLLVGIMALSMIPTALATTDYSNGTEVKYEGQGAAQYTITVPALLAPEGSGTVTLSGTWASDCKVKVTADISKDVCRARTIQGLSAYSDPSTDSGACQRVHLAGEYPNSDGE